MQNLATTWQLEGKFSEAEKLFETVLSLRQRILGPGHNDTLATRESLGTTLLPHGQFADAEKQLRPLLEIRTRLSPGTWRMATASGEVGEAVARERRFAEAEVLLLAGYNGARNPGRENPSGGKA